MAKKPDDTATPPTNGSVSKAAKGHAASPDESMGLVTAHVGVAPIQLGDEMKKSYMEYAMSVIVARALPDVRDGLKPVHRRILYAMNENGYDWSKPFRKSARIVGDVMGKYHPHGDQAIYDAMVRMAQDFSLRLPLIAGQGNFGSLDGDPPAAMRYTEARLAKSAETLLTDIDSETVEWGTNYDDSVAEPLVLPARIPNLLANGASGIAVGMATNIPPHNLGELLRALIALVHKPTMAESELKKIVLGPDFPTGALILGREGINQYFATGRGSIKMRGRATIETFGKEREMIVITEIPYQVNKATMIEKMAELVQSKVIEGVSDIRDESDRQGIRVVLEIKKDATAQVILQQLYKFSPLQTNFGVNMLSLNNGLPEMLSVGAVLRRFIEFRDEVITRRSRFLLRKAETRAHLVAGLVIATINIDAMIALIKSAENPEDAKNKMMAKQWEAGEALPFLRLVEEGSKAQAMLAQYKVSEEQAKAILDLRLHRLTALEKNKLGDEMKELAEDIKKYRQLLQDGESRKKLMVEEFEQSLKEFATPRRTEIVAEQGEQDITELIEKEDMVVSVTFGGYIKRVGLSSYRTQKRGGKGKVGMVTKEDDFVWKIFIANTHTDMLFFSSMGRCYKLKVFEIPESSPAGKGKALVNILPLAVRERITTVLALPEADQWENKYMIFATASGYVRRNLLSDFADERKAGKVAMKLDDGDSLVGVAVCDDGQDIFLATEQSRAIRFAISRKTEDGDEKGVRVFSGRASNGVSAVKLATGDKVVAMEVMNRGEEDSERRDSYLAVANAVARLKDKTYAASGSEEALRDKKKVADFDKDIFHKMKEEEQFMLTVNDMGMGQLCSSYDYRTTGRGGQGISNMASDGKIIDAFLIAPQDDEIMLITDSGQTIRLATKSMRKVGRNSKGIKLASLGEGQKIASVAHVSDAVSDDKENDDKENDDKENDDKESSAESTADKTK